MDVEKRSSDKAAQEMIQYMADAGQEKRGHSGGWLRFELGGYPLRSSTPYILWSPVLRPRACLTICRYDVGSTSTAC